MNVFFFEDKTNDLIGSYYMPANWEFKVGQVIKAFWGCESTVTKVDIEMQLIGNDLIVIQKVWVDRKHIY